MLLLAKTLPSARRLSALFKTRAVRKTYLAICHGDPCGASGACIVIWMEAVDFVVVALLLFIRVLTARCTYPPRPYQQLPPPPPAAAAARRRGSCWWTSPFSARPMARWPCPRPRSVPCPGTRAGDFSLTDRVCVHARERAGEWMIAGIAPIDTVLTRATASIQHRRSEPRPGGRCRAWRRSLRTGASASCACGF